MNIHKILIGIRHILSLIIILAIIVGINNIFTPNWNYPIFHENLGMTLTNFDDLDKDVEVFFLGSSGIGYSISPMELYDSDGIVSYNLATSNQRIEDTEYFIKEIYNNDYHPQLIVIDVSMLFFDDDWEVPYRYVTDIVSLDKAKMELINNYIEKKTYDNVIEMEEEKTSFYIPLYKYHSRWNELNYNDFSDVSDNNYYNQGYIPTAIINGTQSSYENSEFWSNEVIENQKLEKIITEVGDGVKVNNDYEYNYEISKKNIEALNRIKQLCYRNQSELLLVKVPTNRSAVEQKSAWTDYKHNQVVSIANDLDVPFWDMNSEDIGIDWKYDTPDCGAHLNYNGAMKASKAMAKYLVVNYDVEEITNNSYEKKLKLYNENKRIMEIELECGLEDYLDLLDESKLNYSIVISAKDDMVSGLSDEERKAIMRLGIGVNLEEMDNKDSFLAFITNGEVEVASISNRCQTYESTYNDKEVEIISGGLLDGNVSSILIDGYDYSMNMRGINIVVIDDESGLVIDRATCDTFNPEHQLIHDIGNLQYEYNEYLLGRQY